MTAIKRHQTNIMIDIEQHELLRTKAFNDRVTVSSLIRYAIDKYVANDIKI